MKKKVCLSMVLALSATMMFGCAKKETADSIMADMTKVMSEKDAYSANMYMKVGIGVPYGESTFSMSASVEADADYSEKTQTTHVDGAITVDFLGQSETTEMNTYTVIDGNTSSVYAYNPSDESWTVTNTTYESDIDSWIEKLNNVEQAYVLYDEKETVEDKDCYVIDSTIKVKDIVDILSDTESELEEALDTYKDELEESTAVTTTLHIDAKSKELVKATVDADDILNNLLAEDNSLGITFDEFDFEMTFSDVEDATSVTVPTDVLENAIDDSINTIESYE